MFNEQSWILNRAKLTPEKVALIDIQTKRTWTYEELAQKTIELSSISTFTWYKKR